MYEVTTSAKKAKLSFRNHAATNRPIILKQTAIRPGSRFLISRSQFWVVIIHYWLCWSDPAYRVVCKCSSWQNTGNNKDNNLPTHLEWLKITRGIEHLKESHANKRVWHIESKLRQQEFSYRCWWWWEEGIYFTWPNTEPHADFEQSAGRPSVSTLADELIS